MDNLMKEYYQQRTRAIRQSSPKEWEAFLLDWQQKAREQENQGVWLEVSHELGLFYRSLGQYDKSIEVFAQVGQCIGSRFGKNGPEYAALLNNLAGTHRLAGNKKYAIRLFQDALAIYQAQRQTNTSACASIYGNLSQTEQELGEWEQAAEYLEKCLQYLRLSGRVEELGPGYHNLALLYRKPGQPEKTQACIDKALAEFQAHSGEEISHYAEALNGLGGLLYETHQYERAAQVYEQAAEYIARFYGKNHEYAVNRQHQAWALRGMGNLQKAYQALWEAETICAKLYGSQNERVRAVQDELRQLSRMIAKTS